MMVNFKAGIQQKKVYTGRLETAYLEAGTDGNTPVVLIHGNVSCSWFFQDLMLNLANAGYKVYAPDMRGFGDSQTLPVDATQGLKDFAQDLDSWVTALNLPKFHLLGWSMGGNIALEYASDHADHLRSIVLEAAASPFGFGGVHGEAGTPNFADYAGSGGGTANPEFVERLKNGDESTDSPNSPRNVMNTFYFKPPFKVDSESEDVFVAAMLATKTGDGNYPGNMTVSENWPTVAPGDTGVNNAISSKYQNQMRFDQSEPKVPVLWVRGDGDQIVADNSLFDFGTLGQLGAVPGYPGAEIFPPQPMLGQLRYLLTRSGVPFDEVVLADCGHAPHLEKASEFNQLLLDFFKDK
jgi:pimeloyl-ACP methyl ester carboxylesterase